MACSYLSIKSYILCTLEFTVFPNRLEIKILEFNPQAYKNRLAWEKRQLPPRESLLHQGIDRMLDTLGGPTPWKTKWKFLGVKTLTALMCTAAQYNCILTAFFLQQAGAQSFLLSEGGCTSLHAALHFKHWNLAAAMVKDMSASLYISDSSGVLPKDIMPNYLREEIEEVSLFGAYLCITTFFLIGNFISCVRD